MPLNLLVTDHFWIKTTPNWPISWHSQKRFASSIQPSYILHVYQHLHTVSYISSILLAESPWKKSSPSIHPHLNRDVDRCQELLRFAVTTPSGRFTSGSSKWIASLRSTPKFTWKNTKNVGHEFPWRNHKVDMFENWSRYMFIANSTLLHASLSDLLCIC